MQRMSEQMMETLAILSTDSSPIIPFDPAHHRMVRIDLSVTNERFDSRIFQHTELFAEAIDQFLRDQNADFACGGYAELRDIYNASHVFDDPDAGEPRRFHLGFDIWGAAGTPVFAPIDGRIHSTAMNAASGDYGATIIMEHTVGTNIFYSLYGHLSEADLMQSPGALVKSGEIIGHFGKPSENGNWPPHLHFQLILNLEGYVGDYPGVCKYSERSRYMENCPDPFILLGPHLYLC